MLSMLLFTVEQVVLSFKVKCTSPIDKGPIFVSLVERFLLVLCLLFGVFFIKGSAVFFRGEHIVGSRDRDDN